ncbi:hypothetical protein ACFQV2_15925 [Actinokineospora soli]|uniref:Uncharacterized protein n=1 Tax=Actinokineospora soli TaxID=1048753 RepID=A0ABW2TP33_9PSEU
MRALLPDLLGAAARWPLDRPPWPSDVADDHTPSSTPWRSTPTEPPRCAC